MKCLKKKNGLLLFVNKLIEKYLILVMLTLQSFIRKKTKSVKQSEIITYQAETFENPK